jgi:spore maturation protein CgeB
MKQPPLRIVVLGLSLSSSWGNGHATTYRALLKGLSARGHELLFLERDAPWYEAHRDLLEPPYCRLELYSHLGALRRYATRIARADAVLVGSFVPDGIEVGEWVLANARGVTAFYDIDTPATLASIEAGTCEYLAAEQISRYDIYLSFTSGPTLRQLTTRYGARCARALYCSVDNDAYRPRHTAPQWDLGYLGTYSPDRQPALERLLLEPARRMPHLRFVVAGAQYPSSLSWPANVERIVHVAPTHHAAFYSSLRWALNVTRADMIKAGHSPSVRLFEAAASGAPIVSDRWTGLEELFEPGDDIVVAAGPDDVQRALAMPDARRKRIAVNGRRRVLAQHTSQHRSAELERYLRAAIQGRSAGHGESLSLNAS